MTKLIRASLSLSALTLALTPLVGCWWVGTSATSTTTGTQVTTSGPAGKIAQGAISGATVWADAIGAGTQGVIDSAETSTKTTTNSSGAFTFPVTPSYKYIVVSQGGTDTLTGETAGTIITPAGAKSASPFTTLVALDSTGKLATNISLLLPNGASFDTDLTASGSVSPAALFFLTSVTNAVTIFDSALQTAAGSVTLSTQQTNAVNLTLYSQMATTLAGKPAADLKTTDLLAADLTSALTTALNTTATNNSNIHITGSAALAQTIANAAVATSANVVGNATSTAALKSPAITPSTVQNSATEVVVVPTGTLTEATAVGPSLTALKAAVATASTTAAASVTATATPTSYAPPAIAVVNNPSVLAAHLGISLNGSSWNVSNLTLTFTDNMTSDSSAHSVYTAANYTFTSTGGSVSCTPQANSYVATSNTISFTCQSLPSGTFTITAVKGGVQAAVSGLGLLTDNSKSFSFSVTGITGGSTSFNF